jgi:hypothetical protein
VNPRGLDAEYDAIVERMRSLCAALGTPVVRTTEGLEARLGEDKEQYK